MRWMAPVLAVAACGPSLQGDWEGEVDCKGWIWRVDLEVARIDARRFEGEASVNFTQGVTLRYDAEADLDQRGRGSFDLDLECTRVSVNNGDVTWTCADQPRLDFDGDWSDPDEIELENDNCDAVLERQ